ncbi:MAG: prepilin-type N-terminal cleavage/methylation domain-containing protein [Mizugakiibacter sp.]|uniref:prepilin-type N-terminal cleavage/methylation domain-containing protein n=1 Tax=Mizugakiibacter sp. TaxID=1972610 RepID=UPI0031C0C07D|nr:prepilin-type N-terminal cleavage/methylation domain-containing protein [Xanthomonadaceae bacterium]
MSGARARSPMAPPRRAPDRAATARGFTLFEVLLAIALLAVLLAGVWGGLSAATRAVRFGDARDARLDAMRATQDFLRRQLAQALPLPYEIDPHGGQPEVFDGAPTSMRFLAPLPGYLARGGPYLQTLKLVRDGDAYALTLDYARWNGPAARAPAADEPPEVLLTGIRGGRFAYRGIGRDGRMGEWVPAWPRATRPPALVRIELDLGERGRVDWPVLETPLRLGQGAVGPATFNYGKRR